MFNTSMENLKSLFNTDMYKQSVFNLMCVQYSEQGFEKWVQRYQNHYQSGMAFVFSQRMKLDEANHAKMLAGVRAFASIERGAKIKVMEPDKMALLRRFCRCMENHRRPSAPAGRNVYSNVAFPPLKPQRGEMCDS